MNMVSQVNQLRETLQTAVLKMETLEKEREHLKRNQASMEDAKSKGYF